MAKIIVAALIVAVIVYMGFRIKSLKAENAEQFAEIIEYRTANADWKAKTDAANAAIDLLQREAEATARVVANAQKQAAAAQQIADDEAKKIEAMTPQDKNDCVAAKKLTDTYFGKKRP